MGRAARGRGWLCRGPEQEVIRRNIQLFDLLLCISGRENYSVFDQYYRDSLFFIGPISLMVITCGLAWYGGLGEQDEPPE